MRYINLHFAYLLTNSCLASQLSKDQQNNTLIYYIVYLFVMITTYSQWIASFKHSVYFFTISLYFY